MLACRALRVTRYVENRCRKAVTTRASTSSQLPRCVCVKS
jgi:hypothetical protein